MPLSEIVERGKLMGYAGACIIAGLPSAFAVPLPLTLAVTPRFRREAMIKRLHFMVGWARFCRKTLLRIDLDRVGAENLPASTRGRMFISNHQSWIDILVLMDSLNTVSFLSKEMVRYIPVIGLCAYGGGTIFFDRKAHDSRTRALQQVIRMCRESTAVVIFPEGTRSFDGEIRQQIHPGAIRAAHAHGLKVIPVGLDGTCQVLPKSMDRIFPGQRVAVTIGEVIDPAESSSAEEFSSAVWDRVTSLHRVSRARLRGEQGNLVSRASAPSGGVPLESEAKRAICARNGTLRGE